MTLHRSKLNHSDKPRRAFFIQYVDANGTIGNDDLPVVDKPMVYMVSGEADYSRRPQRSAP